MSYAAYTLPICDMKPHAMKLNTTSITMSCWHRIITHTISVNMTPTSCIKLVVNAPPTDVNAVLWLIIILIKSSDYLTSPDNVMWRITAQMNLEMRTFRSTTVNYSLLSDIDDYQTSVSNTICSVNRKKQLSSIFIILFGVS